MAETWKVAKLDVTVEYKDSIPVIIASGEADLITSRKLISTVESLVNTGHYKLIFDFREISYIDSSGFRVLLTAKKQVADKRGDVVLISAGAPVERIYNLLKLDSLIYRTDTVEDAIEKLKNI